jgi:hypothetical protein
MLFSLLTLCSANLFSQTIYSEQHKVFGGIDKIEVKGSFCDVEIIGSENEDVKFDGVIKGTSFRNKKFEIEYNVVGNMLSVWIDSPFSFSGRIEAKLQFSVPSGIEVLVKNSSGDVYCEGLVSKYTYLLAGQLRRYKRSKYQRRFKTCHFFRRDFSKEYSWESRPCIYIWRSGN